MKLKFEYSKFDEARDGKFFAECKVKELTENSLLVWEIEPLQFQKPEWFPKAFLVDIKNRKTNKPLGEDQTLNYVEVYYCEKGYCMAETRLFDNNKPDFRNLLFTTPLNLLLQC